jgi:hypothetical protein
MIYKPSYEDFLRVKEFALESSKFHMNSNRNSKELVSDIIIGKLGELAFKHWMGNEISDVDLQPKIDPDPGWDFVKSDGTRIQVKTIRKGVNWVSFTNWYWEELAVIRYDKNLFELQHIKTKSEINGIAKSSKFRGFYYEA